MPTATPDPVFQLLRQPALQFLLYSLLFAAVAMVYGYPEGWNGPIVGMHAWRQADGAAIAANYAEHGMDFFAPRMSHLLAGDGRAVGEFPIVYYLVGGLYTILGTHEGIFRTVQLLFMFVGGWYLFRLYQLLLKDVFWAMGFTLLLLSSPLIGYYGPNFMPDPPAFFLGVMGLYWLFRHRASGGIRHFHYFLLFFLFAGLLKITALIPFVAVCVLLIFEKFLGWRIAEKGPVFPSSARAYFLPVLALLILVASWYGWAIRYNQLHSTNYFSTKTWPIWELSGAEIGAIAQKVGSDWRKIYFSSYAFLAYGLLFAGLMLSLRLAPRFLRRLLGVVALGMGAFLLLWYYNFLEHDYYFFNLLPFFVLLPPLSYSAFRLKFPQFFHTRFPWLPIAFSLLLLLSFRASAYHQEDRRTPGSWVYEACNPDLYTLSPYLNEIGISPETPVISIPDQSPNLSLLAMRRRGFTDYAIGEMQASDIADFVQKGARYFVIHQATALKRPAVQAFLGPKIGQWRSVAIYEINTAP